MASDGIKILIVDDDEEVLIALERLLESEGYSTATAWGGREALALSEKLHFDLLLVDEHVGDLDFDALLAGLRRRQPRAFQLLMHTRQEPRPNCSLAGVCKWEHAEMKARIRRYLAA
jgi:CheY-like chemotaxis protein